MSFENFATLFGQMVSNDRAAIERLKATLESEFNQAINQKFSSLNLGGGASASASTPSTDPAVLSRLSAVEQALQSMGSKFADLNAFEADSASKFSAEDQDSQTNHDRLTKIETALSDVTTSLSAAAQPLTDLPDTSASGSGGASGSYSDGSGTGSQGATGGSGDSNGSAANADNTSPASGSATNGQGGPAGTGSQGFDPVDGQPSPTGLAPAFGQVQGDTAVTAAPVEIAPGTGQFVDPHATNPAAVATGAPAPVSGSAGQPGGDTSAVAGDSVPNSAEASRSAPRPTAPNIASPGPFNPATARMNPAPMANTEQDAPKAPVINAVPSKMQSADPVPVSANTATAGGVGQSNANEPGSAS